VGFLVAKGYHSFWLEASAEVVAYLVSGEVNDCVLTEEHAVILSGHCHLPGGTLLVILLRAKKPAVLISLGREPWEFWADAPGIKSSRLAPQRGL